MDGRVRGRGCVALMMHVISKGCALPFAWRVRPGPKGHCPEELHIALVELIGTCLPEGSRVGWLGDGECEGTTLQETLTKGAGGRRAAPPRAPGHHGTAGPVASILWGRVASQAPSSRERRGR